MSIGTPVGYVNAPAANGSTGSLSMGGSGVASAGCAVCVVSLNSGTGTCPTPSGWTAYGSNPIISGSTLELFAFYRDVPAGWSQALSFALGGLRRWAAGGLYVPGATVAALVTDTDLSASATGVTIRPGTFTPGGDNWLRVGLGVTRNNVDTVSHALAVPAGWSRAFAAQTTIGTIPEFAIWADWIQLGAAAAQADVSASYTGLTGTRTAFGAAFAPIPDVPVGTTDFVLGGDESLIF